MIYKLNFQDNAINGVFLYEKDFGQINLQELYRNFADYAPYTKLRIYLPGAGVRELNPDDYMDVEGYYYDNRSDFESEDDARDYLEDEWDDWD